MTNKDFEKEYNAIVERAIRFSGKSRREGLLALEEETNDEISREKIFQRDIFELGIKLVIYGADIHHIDKILSNIIELEIDEDKKILKKIQKEAVLQIQARCPERILFLMLNSYVNIGIEEAINEYLGD